MFRAGVAHEVRSFTDQLRDAPLAHDAAELIDLIGALEDLKSAACAAQADASVAFDAARRSEQAAVGVPPPEQGRGVAAEVALARRESPHRGQSLLGLAKVLAHELPETRARLRDGSLSEYRATLIARETACVNRRDRLEIDRVVCGDRQTVASLGTRRLLIRVKRLVAQRDPGAVTRRARRATADRCVTLRPAPDTMTYLTALVPVAQGVAAYASLTREAESLRAGGDGRSRGQAMADVLVSRLTGQDELGSRDHPTPVAATIAITLPASALAGGHDAAAISADRVAPEVVPAAVAREVIAHSLRAGVGAWYRRLYVSPQGGLIAMTSRQRHFPDGLADFLTAVGDGICATPWCDAPIRHIDHIVPAGDGGPTEAANGQGLCEACNHAKEAPGWRQRAAGPPGDPPVVATETPTGHTYEARGPTHRVDAA